MAGCMCVIIKDWVFLLFFLCFSCAIPTNGRRMKKKIEKSLCSLFLIIWQSRVVELRKKERDIGQYHIARAKNINRLESIEEGKQCA